MYFENHSRSIPVISHELADHRALKRCRHGCRFSGTKLAAQVWRPAGLLSAGLL